MPAGPTVGRLTVLCILSALAASSAAGSFIDHGIGAEVAELRSMVPTVTADGRTLLIASPTDNGPTGYLLVTDLATGETTQHSLPRGRASVQIPSERSCTAAGCTITRRARSCWSSTRHCRRVHVPRSPLDGSTSPYLCFTEGLDGTVWAGGVYNTGLISYDPRTQRDDRPRADG
jgi:hypothetical protein